MKTQCTHHGIERAPADPREPGALGELVAHVGGEFGECGAEGGFTEELYHRLTHRGDVRTRRARFLR